jgi:hypothetical protein
MIFKCIIGLHSWNGCKCTECGKIRDQQHNWLKENEKCSICGKTCDGQVPNSTVFYNAYGLDLSPENARKLSFELACRQVSDLHILSDNGDWLEAARGEDYSVILYFNKPYGLFEVIISNNTTSQFLGMGIPNPEKIWSLLGYHMQEDLGEKVTWSNGDAKIVAYYGNSGYLNEINYAITGKEAIDAEAANWRELSFFSGGRGCILSAEVISGNCYEDIDAVYTIIRFVKEKWKGDIPHGFWLVKAEAFDTSTGCPYCLGIDSQYENILRLIKAEMERADLLPLSDLKSFRVKSKDFMEQTLIDMIHIKGFLQS